MLSNAFLWKQPLPDVRTISFPEAAILLVSDRDETDCPRGQKVMRTLGTSHACAEVSNITAHAPNGFLSLTAPLGKKIGRD